MNQLLYCLPMIWTLATGPADHYSVYRDTESNEIQANLPLPPSEVCQADGAAHRYAVRAFDAEGNPGPLSDWSEPVQRVLPPQFRLVPMPPELRADLDGNGTIGFGDWFEFVKLWGKRLF